MKDEEKTRDELVEELHDLRARAGRAESILAAMGDGVIIQDTSYRITYQNEINSRVFGDHKGEFCYQVYEGIDHVCEWCPIEKTFRDGKIHTVLREVAAPDGTRYYNLTASPLRDAAGEIVAGIKVVRDVTDRELARQQLADEKELSDALINSLPGHFFLVDAGGKLHRWNRNVELFTGYSPGEVAAMDALDFFEGGDREVIAGKLQECFEKGEASVEASLVTKSGEKTPFFYRAARIEIAGEPFLTGLGMDVSALKEAEERIAYSEKYLASIISNEPECVKLMDPDGTVLDMNPAGLAMLEADRPEQIIGQNLMDLVDPEYCDAFADLSKRVCGGDKCSLEFQVIGLNGTRRWLETRSVPFEDEATGSTLILAVTRDVTERKRVEDELREAKRDVEMQNLELKKLDRMKDSLLRDVSHELKTPVAKHAMQLEILGPIIESLQMSEREASAFQVMRESIRRQESVIRNLLDLARLESGGRIYDRQEVSLESIFSRIKSDYQYALKVYGVTLDVDLPPLLVVGDSEMLWHVFSNIMNNAIKYRRENEPLKITIRAEPRDGEVHVRFRDNGIGLEESEKNKLFTRFYQVSPSSEGSGVGLAICRRIVRDLGGRIWMESEGENMGVTAWIALPASVVHVKC